MRLLTYEQLRELKGVFYTRRHLRDLVAAGKFPKPIEVSEARIAWLEHEVDAWLEAKVAKRNAAAT